MTELLEDIAGKLVDAGVPIDYGREWLQQLVNESADNALQQAADRIVAELICCEDDNLVPRHHICRWGIASRKLVLSYRSDHKEDA